jgi:thioredoxin 1
MMKEAAMAAKELNASAFDDAINNATKPVLVDFWASWCGPCRLLSPIVEELADEMAEVLDVYKVNVDDNQDLAMRYKVMSIPTLILFKEGKIVHTMVGAQPRAKLAQELAQYM